MRATFGHRSDRADARCTAPCALQVVNDDETAWRGRFFQVYRRRIAPDVRNLGERRAHGRRFPPTGRGLHHRNAVLKRGRNGVYASAEHDSGYFRNRAS